MKTAIFPGTFSIFHQGHIDVLKRALKIFDHIYVVVAINPNKECDDLDTRFINTKKTVESLSLKNVSVLKCETTISDIGKIKRTCFIIRGIRDEKDFIYEMELFNSYKQDWKSFEVVYFFSEKENKNISSRKILSVLKKEKYEN